MPIPPRKWVGYATLTAGLSLLYDTYTFLRTSWSPLHVPLSVPEELAIGYLLILVGMALLCAPALVRLAHDFAPDSSVKLGSNLAHCSVELRQKKRLPLTRCFSTLPNRGLLGGSVVLLLLLPMYLIVEPQESLGIYIRLRLRFFGGFNETCLAGPLIVTVHARNHSSYFLLNGVETPRQELEQSLKTNLARRRNWDVFVEADDAVDVAGPVSAIDVINDLHAKAVILTPVLRKQIVTECEKPIARP